MIRLFVLLALAATAVSAADLTGIWMGEVSGRNGEKQDLAFQFQIVKGALTGVMFGDEFDLPVQDLHVEGNSISFTVTSTNYYDGRRNQAMFTGTLSDTTLELKRKQGATETAITLKKLTELGRPG